MKVRSLGKKYMSGLATLEILIAFTILILCVGGVIIITFGNQSLSTDLEVSNQAIYKAQKMLEEARILSYFDFNLVNPKIETEISGPILFTKNIDVKQVDLFTKEVKSTIAWQSAGRALSLFQTTLVTNRQAGGTGTCSSVLTGDWKNPILTNYEFGKDLVGDPANIFPISAIEAYKGKLFVSIDNSTSSSLPTFFEFDISNPSLPILLGSVDNDSSSIAGPNAIAVTDTYAYVASSKGSNFSTCVSGSCGQLQIIDVSGPAPILKKTFKIPGVTGAGGQAIGKSIFYKNGLVYLGLSKTLSGPEFNIIDVSNPLSLVYKGGYSVSNAVNDIFVKDSKAYIATPNSENMTIVDVVNSSSPLRLGGYSPAGGSNGESIYTVGNTVYLGRTFGTNEFHILDAKNPVSPSITASKDIGTGTGTSINSLFARDYLAFMITNAKFEVWNILDPVNISPWTQNGVIGEFLTLPGKGLAMDCEGNYMYVGSVPVGNKGYISIITAN